ncbi:MAG: phage tail protein [Roseobacter sp. MedPE-SW]|nr:MAG: phage tail protein [Roseobacter sp. MedPE-SW]
MSRGEEPHTRRRLVLEDPQRISDGAGGYSESWAPLGVIWGALKSQTGRTAGQDGGSLSLQRYKISLRATPQGSRSRPRPGQRFRQGQRLFRIEAVSESDPAGRYLTCQCIEEVAP